MRPIVPNLTRRRFSAGLACSAIAPTVVPRGIVARQATPSPPAHPSPPTQPATGPGGADYAYNKVLATAYDQDGWPHTEDEGKDAIHHFWLFEPANPRPGTVVDTPLPVVIFLPGCCDFHQWAAVRPDYTRSWIDHLVRLGAVVIYPMSAGYFFGIEVENVKAAVGDALAELDAGGHVPVDLNRTVVVGLQIGGAHALNLIAAPPHGLPTPAALMLVGPFAPPEDTGAFDIFQIAEGIAAIPATTRVVLVEAEAVPERDDGLENVWLELAHASTVPADQRAYVVLRSDGHGAPALIADHTTASTDAVNRAGGHLDALDWYGTWKLLDALIACSFDGEWCEYAFGDTPEVRYMGTWSDGVPVTEAVVVEDPIPRGATPAG